MKGYSGIIFDADTYSGHEDLTVPYFINCCGYLKTTGINVSIRRKRCDYYLIYLINGLGHYKLAAGTISADAGSIILYRPGEEQDYYYIGNENTELYWIHFTGSEMENLLTVLLGQKRSIYKMGIDSDCIKIFEDIIHEIQIKKPQFHQICIGLLIQLLSLFSRKITFLEKGEGFFRNTHIENVIKSMHTEYQQNHSIKYYAEKCNLSEYQFIRNFKSGTRLPPAKYIEKIRLAKAKELLNGTDLTISEISGMVGYNDPFYFSKVFKKATNTTPTLFRKQGEGWTT